MKIAETIRLLAVSMAAVGFLLPQPSVAATPVAVAQATHPTTTVTPAIQANQAFFAVPTARTAQAVQQKPVALAAHAAKAKRKTLTQDVALQQGGVLMGQLVDTSGTPISATPVSLLQNNLELANTITDNRGRFTFKALHGGIYQVVTPNSNRLYRLWAAGTAPKSAGQVAQIVAGQPVMRGQHTMGRMGKWLTSPLGLTAVAATAVAVPVALHNSNRDPAE